MDDPHHDGGKDEDILFIENLYNIIYDNWKALVDNNFELTIPKLTSLNFRHNETYPNRDTRGIGYFRDVKSFEGDRCEVETVTEDRMERDIPLEGDLNSNDFWQREYTVSDPKGTDPSSKEAGITLADIFLTIMKIRSHKNDNFYETVFGPRRDEVELEVDDNGNYSYTAQLGTDYGS